MGIPLAPLRFTKGEGPLCPSDISPTSGVSGSGGLNPPFVPPWVSRGRVWCVLLDIGRGGVLLVGD